VYKKEVETRCPECQTKLLVDVGTGKILRAERKQDDARPKGERFDDVLHRVGGRAEKTEAAFGDALRQEAEKKKKIEDAFEEAKRRAAARGDEGEPPPDFNW
jgi:hypothetical protein